MKNLLDYLKFIKNPEGPESLSTSLLKLVDDMISGNLILHNQASDYHSDKKILISYIPNFTTDVEEGINIALAIENQFTKLESAGPGKEQLLQKLHNKTKELNEFSYIISHDLKAPLRAISSLTLWLKSDYGDKFDAEGQQFLELLLDRVSKMDKLIDCILKFSRVANSNEVKGEQDLNQLLPGIIASLAVPETIKITIDNTLPILHTGELSITQVFQQLLGNALKYIGKPDGEIHIGSISEGEFWKIYVKDNGPGIESKYHEKIFEIFQSLQSNDTDEIAGMGLTIVKKIMESNDGKVWVESTPGAGATFYFTWPK